MGLGEVVAVVRRTLVEDVDVPPRGRSPDWGTGMQLKLTFPFVFSNLDTETTLQVCLGGSASGHAASSCFAVSEQGSSEPQMPPPTVDPAPAPTQADGS